MNLKEKADKLHALRLELQKITEGEVKADMVEEIKRRSDEINALSDELKGLREAEAIAQANAHEVKAYGEVDRKVPFSGDGSVDTIDAFTKAIRNMGAEHEVKSLGQMFVESDAYKNRSGSTSINPITADIDDFSLKSVLGSVKATMETSAGWAPFVPRSGRVVESAQRRPIIADLIPQEDTTQSGFKYMEETTFTNSAAVVAEGATKPESALALTERTVTLAKIATTLPVTDEQLEDVPQIRAYIDNRLSLQLALKEEDLLLSNTSATGFDGFLVKSGVQSEAAGVNPVPTAILRGMTKVRHTGFAEPTGIVMHPNDWQNVVTLQETTGGYIFRPGGPVDEVGQRLWGLPVVVTPAMTENTALIGDFRMFSQILRRTGIRIDIGWSNDDWVKNIQRIRAEERMTLFLTRAAAFCKVTGI